jgi:hypothetical protein
MVVLCVGAMSFKMQFVEELGDFINANVDEFFSFTLSIK